MYDLPQCVEEYSYEDRFQKYSELEPTSIIITSWLLFIFVATLLEKKTSIGSLSMKTSWQELTQKRTSKLNCVDYIRVAAILWVMVNHIGSEGRIDILERLPSAATFKENIHSHPFFGPVFGNSALGVEIFLVLSGLLAARSWSRFQMSSKRLDRTYVCFLVKRIFRLFPSVAVFVWLAQGSYSKQYLPRFWNTMISSCGWKGFAAHLTFTGNWQSAPTCLGYLWYLGLDAQLYALAPILMIALSRHAALGTLLIGGLILISTALRAWYCTFYDICNKSDIDIPFISYPNQTAEDLERIYRGLWDIYSRPCTKCGPFFIGMFAGYLSTKIGETPKITQRVLKFINFLAVVGILFCIFGILPQYHSNVATTYDMIYTAIFRSLFALCVTWIILYCIYWSPLEFSPLFSILAQLTFQAYLIHMPVVYLTNHINFLQTAEGPWAVLCVLPFVAILSYAGALLLYLFVESPMAKLANGLYDFLEDLVKTYI
uniref:Acyltransferase 3 domain-containing protein n=1 Tax=Acrobeloides nanus TaxID=290746 RepID=A0A914ED10_9BILA